MTFSRDFFRVTIQKCKKLICRYDQASVDKAEESKQLIHSELCAHFHFCEAHTWFCLLQSSENFFLENYEKKLLHNISGNIDKTNVIICFNVFNFVCFVWPKTKTVEN